MNESSNWIKHHTIRLDENAERNIQSGVIELKKKRGILDIAYTGSTLDIKYDLKEISLNDMESELHLLSGNIKLGFFQKLQYKLICYMEINQRNNLQITTSWKKRMQDIHIYHYQHQAVQSNLHQPHLWQKYINKE